MAHIEYSPIAHSETLCLVNEDLKVLIPCIKSALNKARKRYEKYRDIHEIGEATERQQTQLIKAEEEEHRLKDILDKAENLIY